MRAREFDVTRTHVINVNLGFIEATLRIMGSQNWWFGDPRPLLYTS